jgi:hypothetical protein
MRLVFDIEANGLLDEATKVWCIVAKPIDEYHEGILTFGPDEIEEGLMFLLKAEELIGHNIIGYDLPLLEKLHAWTPGIRTIITDTVVLSRLYKSDRPLPNLCPGGTTPHSLAAWGYRLGRGKPDHTDWTQYSPEMLHRCTEDVEINDLLHKELVAERDSHSWLDSTITEHGSATLMRRQQEWGVPLNVGRVERLFASTERTIQRIDEATVPLIPEVPLPQSKQGTWPKKQFKKDGTPTLHALRYYGVESHDTYRTDILTRTAPINLASDKQVKQYLLSIGWTPTEWNFKKGPNGKPIRDEWGDKIRTSPRITIDSMDSVVWEAGHEDIGREIVRRLMVAHRRSMLKGWLRDVRPDGRIEARALAMGTPTGRMTHRQVVNVPGKTKPMGLALRSCYGTVPGKTRVGIDLRSCQVFMLCHYMPDEGYREAARTSDPHVYVQEMGKLATRDLGKKLHYSVLFGAGKEKLSSDLGMSRTEAALVIKAFFKGIPELPKLLAKLEAEWKRNGGWIEGLDGRKVWVRAKHMLLNYLLQSGEAIVMKNFQNHLMNEVHYLQGWVESDPVELVTTMHDEAQFLVSPEKVDEFKQMAQHSIEFVNEKFDLQFPQAIDIKLGETWAQCH